MSQSVRGGCFASPAKALRERHERHEREQKITPFDHMTTAELRTWAQKFNLENYGKMKKAELAEAVRVEFERVGRK